ncbi:MAG: hypothetical protein AAFR27_15685, partial [Pseudomonadota bacterium]
MFCSTRSVLQALKVTTAVGVMSAAQPALASSDVTTAFAAEPGAEYQIAVTERHRVANSRGTRNVHWKRVVRGSVTSVDPDGYRLFWTIDDLSIDPQATNLASAQKVRAIYQGAPTIGVVGATMVYRTDRMGRPIRIENWPDIRSHILASLEPELGRYLQPIVEAGDLSDSQAKNIVANAVAVQSQQLSVISPEAAVSLFPTPVLFAAIHGLSVAGTDDEMTGQSASFEKPK